MFPSTMPTAPAILPKDQQPHLNVVVNCLDIQRLPCAPYPDIPYYLLRLLQVFLETGLRGFQLRKDSGPMRSEIAQKDSRVCVCDNMYVYVYIHIYIYICVYIYIYIHARIRIDTNNSINYST